MPVRVRYNPSAFVRHVNERVIPEANRLLLRGVQNEARKNFRNRTGRLWRSIRIEGMGVVIGDRIAYYWRFLLHGTRGDGRIWVRRAVRKYQQLSLREAFAKFK